MKVTFAREALLAALQLVASVVPARSPKPILRCAKLEAKDGSGMLMATDLEIGIRVELKDVDVQAAGSLLLPVSDLIAILRESSDATVRLESDGPNTHVVMQRSEFRLPSADPYEYPEVTGFTEKAYNQIPVDLFRQLIKRTIFSTDEESTRFALGGVLLEFEENTVTAVATDGRRLATMQGSSCTVGELVSKDRITIVPTKAMQLVERSMPTGDFSVLLAPRGNDIVVQSDRVTLSARLVEGRFPRWKDVFPKAPATSKVDLVVGPMLSAVRQAAIVTNKDSKGVEFRFSPGKLELRAVSSERGQSRVELPIGYDGELQVVKLDPQFVSDFLRVLDAEESISVELRGSNTAVVFRTQGGYAYVIMPLALEDE